MKLKPVVIYILKLIALAVVYRLGVIVGLSMAYVQSNTSPVWPPTGIAVAALLLFGWQLWPGITLAVFLGSVITGAPLILSIGMSIGNTLEALALVYLLRRFVPFHPSLDRIKDVIGLVLAAIAGTAISATFGGLSLLLTDGSLAPAFWQIWATWWIGDFLGALVVAPFLLVWGSHAIDRLSFRRQAESALVFIALIFVAWYVFFTPQPAGIAHRALLYVIFPFSIWAALRTGQRGATAAIVIVSGIAIWGTTQTSGPFANASKNDSLILLQTFMAVVSLTSLILAAATTERHSASAALNYKIRDLATLNRTSETLLASLGQPNLYNHICQLARNQFEVDVAWIELADSKTGKFTPVAVNGIAIEQLPSLAAFWHDPEYEPSLEVPWIGTDETITAKHTDGYKSVAIFPLFVGGQPMALLNLLSQQENFFDKDRQILLQSFVNLDAIAIQNSWLLDRVRKGNEQLHGLSQRLMEAQEEERLHLSRELHDESGQLLTAIMVQLGLIERNAYNSETVLEHVRELKASVNAIQQNLHSLAVNLRPASLDHLGLVSALEQFIKEFQRQYGLTVEFETTGMQDRRLPAVIETAIFRIVQESLTNVVLHAQAVRVDVILSRKDDSLAVIIEDNGIGFSSSVATDGDHLGLFGMRERIEMLGGVLAIESEPGKGTIVKAEVPCHG